MTSFLTTTFYAVHACSKLHPFIVHKQDWVFSATLPDSHMLYRPIRSSVSPPRWETASGHRYAEMETCLRSTTYHLDPPDLPRHTLVHIATDVLHCSWRRTNRYGAGRLQRPKPKMCRGKLIQNIVNNMCEKFHYDRLRNDRALGNRKTENNKNHHHNNNNNNNNNVPSHWGPVSGSKSPKK